VGHIIGKAWGSTSLLLKTPIIEIHRLVIIPNAYCSLHVHSIKNNSFFVFSGTLFIEVHKNSYDLVDKTVLSKGDLTTVQPGEYHKFIAGPDGAEVLEIYHLEPLSEDIMRKDKGGPGFVDGDKSTTKTVADAIVEEGKRLGIVNVPTDDELYGFFNVHR